MMLQSWNCWLLKVFLYWTANQIDIRFVCWLAFKFVTFSYQFDDVAVVFPDVISVF